MERKVECTVTNLDLSVDTISTIQSTRLYHYCHFEFTTNDWVDCEKRAIFENDSSGVSRAAVIDSGGMCVVPWECLTTPGRVNLAVMGENEHGYVARTNICTIFKISESLLGAEDSQIPTPNAYLKMLQQKLTSPLDENGDPIIGGEDQILVADGKGGLKYVDVIAIEKLDMAEGVEF